MMSFLESERFSQQFPAVYQLAGWTDLQDGEKSLEKERGERRSSVAYMGRDCFCHVYTEDWYGINQRLLQCTRHGTTSVP